MNKQSEQLDAISEMRKLMERSSRFISLSGISGISAGIAAILGASAASVHSGNSLFSPWKTGITRDPSGNLISGEFLFYLLDAIAVIVLAFCSSVFFTWRKAKSQGLPVWDSMSKRLMFNLLLPLAAGGAFCLLLYYYNDSYLIAPGMLLFYGLALVNAGKYTVGDIHILGYIEILLGLICGVLPGYGLLFWTLGFGCAHIIYGMYMHFKYER